MVDALCRSRHWLKADGCLIDLRPADPTPDVMVGSRDQSRPVGTLNVETARRQRHAAADRALARVLDRHLFILEEAREFIFRRFAETADELRDYVASKWKETRLDEITHRRAAEALSVVPGGRLWLREEVAIRRLRPLMMVNA
jgi:hypothetical protein